MDFEESFTFLNPSSFSQKEERIFANQRLPITSSVFSVPFLSYRQEKPPLSVAAKMMSLDLLPPYLEGQNQV